MQEPPAPPEEPSDETLMGRYAAGDVRAFEALFRRHEGRAYAYFLRRTGSPERAQDLYQELFLRIHRARDRYDPTRPFLPWFFQIASHLLVDDLRRAFRARETTIEEAEANAADAAGDRLVEREALERVMEALSPDERYVLLSSRVDGVGYPELAERLGKSVDAVKKMASRAVQRLRRMDLIGASG